MFQKKSLFEYFVYLIYLWYCESKGIDSREQNPNDLSKLKLIKLHFFACSTSDRALSIFNNFHALPYGHVESDVYDLINSLDNFEINRNTLNITGNNIHAPWNLEEKRTVDEIVSNLKKINYNLVNYTAFDLVELSHKWFSWKYSFEQAKRNGNSSSYIDKSLIQNELKIYGF